jgi:hypothetical protein
VVAGEGLAANPDEIFVRKVGETAWGHSGTAGAKRVAARNGCLELGSLEMVRGMRLVDQFQADPHATACG